MKKIFTILIATLSFTLYAEVLCSKTANLIDNGYPVTGDVILEKLGTNDWKIRLTSDFKTAFGPDVRLYLSKSGSFNSASVVEIANLAEIPELRVGSDFSGAYTFNVPSGASVEDYPYILLHCFDFSVPWSKGAFGDLDGSCDPTAIWDKANEEVTSEVYPNPTTGVLNFEREVNELAVYSLSGTLLMSENNILENKEFIFSI